MALRIYRSYLSGPLTNGPNISALKTFYEEIGEVCARKGIEAYVPHRHTDPTLNPDLPDSEVYRLDMQQVSSSDLVIAYVGVPSHGVGAEIERASQETIDVFLLYESSANVSRLIRGNPAVKGQLVFEDFAEALRQLDAALDRWLARRADRAQEMLPSGSK